MSTFKHNKVDIYIKEKSGKRQIRVPWLPETIEYESGGITVASYDIIRRGEVSVPTGTGLAKISWSSIFPGANRGNNSLQRGTWNAPSYYHKILEEWRTSGTTLNVMVTGYPINKDCFITAYSATPTGGFGDMEYNLELTEDRDITITTKKIKTKDQNANKKRPTAANKTAESTGTAYTIKSGDTLWEIAYKFYNDGSKWRQIYEANKEIIESTAKERGYGSSQNGHWIDELQQWRKQRILRKQRSYNDAKHRPCDADTMVGSRIQEQSPILHNRKRPGSTQIGERQDEGQQGKPELFSLPDNRE